MEEKLEIHFVSKEYDEEEKVKDIVRESIKLKEPKISVEKQKENVFRIKIDSENTINKNIVRSKLGKHPDITSLKTTN